jgi:phytoene synthase
MEAKLTDRDLVRLHWPHELRPAFDALFALDDAMASVVASASQPALAAIKLAWWREALEKLDSGAPPAEPRLIAAAAELLPRGISGAELAELESGWAAQLQPEEDEAALEERGVMLFRLLAQILGAQPPSPEHGQLFGYIDAARRGGSLSLDRAQVVASAVRARRSPKALRPLTALSVLAARDAEHGQPFESEATPGRSWTLLKHRFTGR